MVKRAALYIRVSTDEQARHGYSLGEQQIDLEEYAKRNNYAVVGIYADEGVSARKSMRHRGELQRLLHDVEQGMIDVILIKCLDRWFRNIADFYRVKEFLDSHHVDWECTQEKYNTMTTEGRLLLNLKLSIAQNESDQTSDRIRYVNDGKRRRKEVASGSIPIGYAIGKDRHLVPSEDAPLVHALYSHIAAGNSYRSSIPMLQEKFGKRLTLSQIRHMIKNRTYIGEYHGISDFCPPIIERPLFDRVQEILSRNFRAPQYNRVYLFRGLIRCPGCNRILTAHQYSPSDKNRHVSLQYRCAKHMTDLACSFNGIINERKLEKWLLENIQGLLRQKVYEIETQHKRTTTDYAARLNAVKTKLERLKDLYVDGLIDKETYLRDYEPLKEQERDYTSLVARQTRIIPPCIKQTLEWEDIRAKYEELSREERQSLWQSIIKEITFEYRKVPGHYPEKTYHVKFFI